MAEERQIASDEIDVARWLLANGAMKDVSAYSADSLEGVSVVPGCQCGCASIDFVLGRSGETVERAPRRGSNIVAEAYTLWPDGARAGVILWGAEGRLLGIELYDMDPDALRRFPTVGVLRRWEDWFEDEPGGRDGRGQG